MPVVWFLTRFFRVSGLLARHSVRIVRRQKRLPLAPIASFPAAGFDESRAQTVLFTLRHAAETDEHQKVTDLWLNTLKLAQIISDRLLEDLLVMDENLRYWKNSKAQGGHSWRMFVRNGPGFFYTKIRSIIERKNGAKTATDMIEERTLVLQKLQKMIISALGQVQFAADALRLKVGGKLVHENSSQLELFSSTKTAINSITTILIKALKEVKDFSSLISDFDEAKKHLKALAVAQTTSSTIVPQLTIDDLGEELDTATGRTETGVEDLESSVESLATLVGAQVGAVTDKSVKEVLDATSTIAAEIPQLAPVPYWAKSPLKIQQMWLEYSAVTIASLFVVGFFVRHSPLVGSRDMIHWAQTVKYAFVTFVVGPLQSLRNLLFNTFRNSPSIVTRDEYEISKTSLLRMLIDFDKDNGNRFKKDPSVSAKLSERAETLVGMETLMRAYEAELKNPLWYVFTGALARALLIQVQKLKTDVEAAMLQLDSILKANELNVALIAAIPSVLVAGGLLYVLFKCFNNSGPSPFISVTPCRLNLIELQRTLTRCDLESLSSESEGYVYYRLYKVYAACWEVYKNRDKTSSNSEWPSLHKDLQDLASMDIPVAQKLRITERMQSTYKLFKVPRT